MVESVFVSEKILSQFIAYSTSISDSCEENKRLVCEESFQFSLFLINKEGGSETENIMSINYGVHGDMILMYKVLWWWCLWSYHETSTSDVSTSTKCLVSRSLHDNHTCRWITLKFLGDNKRGLLIITDSDCL